MTHKKHSQTTEYQWEQALLDAYYDYRWREVLVPLYQKFQDWNSGELDHLDLSEAIHHTHKQTQEVFMFFAEKHDVLVRMIQLDEAWFQAWLKDNPSSEGYLLG